MSHDPGMRRLGRGGEQTRRGRERLPAPRLPRSKAPRRGRGANRVRGPGPRLLGLLALPLHRERVGLSSPSQRVCRQRWGGSPVLGGGRMQPRGFRLRLWVSQAGREQAWKGVVTCPRWRRPTQAPSWSSSARQGAGLGPGQAEIPAASPGRQVPGRALQPVPRLLPHKPLPGARKGARVQVPGSGTPAQSPPAQPPTRVQPQGA